MNWKSVERCSEREAGGGGDAKALASSLTQPPPPPRAASSMGLFFGAYIFPLAAAAAAVRGTWSDQLIEWCQHRRDFGVRAPSASEMRIQGEKAAAAAAVASRSDETDARRAVDIFA